MIATIAILIASVGLFLYWFRYTCLLILSAKTSRDYAGEVAAANGLAFLTIPDRIRESVQADDMDLLNILLRRDYEIVSALLRHASALNNSGTNVEDVMLRLDYMAMSVWYRVARTMSPQSATRALNEMVDIVTYFANSMGQRSLCAGEL